ncbi:MAG: restriction endonuclease subunit S, partial [Bacteroidia bacterium]|nr:restriction endonuclease subunit S [Bacteroidia bacterium]
MKKIKLKEVCAVNPKDNIEELDMTVSFVPMQKVSETGDIDVSEERIAKEVIKGFTSFIDGDVLMAKITPCMENGKGAIAKGLRNNRGFGSTEFLVIRPDANKVCSDWIYYYTVGKKFRKDCERNMTGSAGQKRVPKTYIENCLIPVPSMEEQRNLVDSLNKAKTIIKLRKHELQKLDDLIKARFGEMFGDRWKNDKGWEQTTLNECATFYNGKAHEQVVDEDGEYILVTSRYIASDMSDYRRTSAMLFPLQVGDICMVMSDVPNGKALAKCVRIEEDGIYTLNQRICCFRDYKLNQVFFYYLLNRHEYLLSFDNGDSQTNLRKNDLLACPVICPPMELQEQFKDFVSQVNKSKASVQKALDETQL